MGYLLAIVLSLFLVALIVLLSARRPSESRLIKSRRDQRARLVGDGREIASETAGSEFTSDSGSSQDPPPLLAGEQGTSPQRRANS